MRALIVRSRSAPLLAGPPLAQVERLPQPSRAERQVEDINRSIVRQQLQMRENQQTQFEINQLRNELQQSRQQPVHDGAGRRRAAARRARSAASRHLPLASVSRPQRRPIEVAACAFYGPVLQLICNSGW